MTAFPEQNGERVRNKDQGRAPVMTSVEEKSGNKDVADPDTLKPSSASLQGKELLEPGTERGKRTWVLVRKAFLTKQTADVWRRARRITHSRVDKNREGNGGEPGVHHSQTPITGADSMAPPQALDRGETR